MPADTFPTFATEIAAETTARVAALLERWLEPADFASCSVSILAGGAVNQNFLIEYEDGRKAVLRLAAPPALADDLGVDMENSIRVAKLAGAAGAGPAVLGSRVPEGDSLIEFLDGMLDVGKIHHGELIGAIGTALRKVHQLPTAGVRRKTAFEDIDEWLEGTRAQGVYPTEKVAVIRPWLESLRETFDRIEGLCVCHRDLNPQNCAYKDGTARIIDWDFSGLDTPYLDLAMLIDYADLDEAEIGLFVRATIGEPTETDMARIAVMRLVNSVREWAWCLNAIRRQEGRTNPLTEYLPDGGQGHDNFYVGYADVNWKRVERITSEPAFERDCELAALDQPGPGRG